MKSNNITTNINNHEPLMDDVEFLEHYANNEFKCYQRWLSKSNPLEQDAFIGLHRLNQELGNHRLRQHLEETGQEIWQRLKQKMSQY